MPGVTFEQFRPQLRVGPTPARMYVGRVTAATATTVTVTLAQDPYDLDGVTIPQVVAVGSGFTVGADVMVIVQSATAYALRVK